VRGLGFDEKLRQLTHVCGTVIQKVWYCSEVDREEDGVEELEELTDHDDLSLLSFIDGPSSTIQRGG
jgi:hypothetical protein